MRKKIALLWAEPSLGLYANRSFESLFRAVGGNSGNLAFVYAIQNQLVGDITFLPWSSTREQVAAYDAVVIPCANQLGDHTDLGGLALSMGEFDKPIIAIGLGAQANSLDEDVQVTPGTLRWVKALASKRAGAVSNIWTRGPFTTQQLDKLGVEGTIVGGCPTHFMHQSSDLGRRIHKSWTSTPLPRAITVAGGHQAWTQVRTVEHQLIAMMQDPLFPGQYITQSPGEMLRVSRNDFEAIEPEVMEQIRSHVAPHYTEDEFRLWCRSYARVYYDIPAWMESLRRYDLTIGPRYHGVALAIQAERMGVTIAFDSRTEEMCIQTGVPCLRAADLSDKPLTRLSLKRLIRFDPDAYDRHRSERAQAYVAFLEGNGLQPADYLKRIAAGM